MGLIFFVLYTSENHLKMENGEMEEEDQEGELRERQQYEFQV